MHEEMDGRGKRKEQERGDGRRGEMGERGGNGRWEKQEKWENRKKRI